ncbi:Flp pilus assembly protein CpaB [Shewanella algae]|uniref:Flp pilus assembly protein CpaB n=1 Tax=Shewanella TaxID=22 RepID=UPI0031F4D44B
MKLKSIDFNWILLLVAIALGGVAAFATKSYFEQREAELRAELSDSDVVMADVLVANQPLEKGMIISEQNMTVRQIRADIVPLEAYHPSQFGEVVGKMLLHPMAPGRPLLTAYVPGHGVSKFSDMLDEGQRAVTIEIDVINSTAGMLVPSDHIDLLLAYDEPLGDNNNNRKKLQLLLEDVTVLATGRRSQEVPDELADTLFEDPASYNTVTLALSVDDAARVSLARNKGSFVTLLRNQQETLPLEFASLYQDEIFEKSASDNSRLVEIIVGGGGVQTQYQEYPNPDVAEPKLQITQQETRTAL